MKKRLLSLLLALVMLCGLLPASALAVEDVKSGSCGEDLTWTLAGGTLTISGTGEMESYSIIDGKFAPWYSYRSSIKTLQIETGAVGIGSQAFAGCTRITGITIPNSVASIGFCAFGACTSLTSVTIPASVTSIGGRAFESCTGLTSVTIQDGVPTIGGSAFEGCTGLTSVTIPASVTSIGSSAFAGCTGLTSVTIQDGVSTIGGSAFEGCTGLTSVTIPASVTSIGGSAFARCTGLTSVTIPASAASIGDRAFENCTGLTSVTIPNGVTSIGDFVFSRCTGLTSVVIGVTSIGDDAFYGCDSLTSVVISDGVTSIRDNIFSRRTSLTSIFIPDSVTSIGAGAFFDCDSLTCVYYGGTRQQWNAIAIDYAGQSQFKNVVKRYSRTGLETPKTRTEAQTQAQKFSDVAPTAWYAEAVNAMAETGLLQGDGTGKFNPDAPITYGEFATILCRIHGIRTDYHRNGHLDIDHNTGEWVPCNCAHWAAGAMYQARMARGQDGARIFAQHCEYVDELLSRGEAISWLVNTAHYMPEYDYGKKEPVGKVWTIDDIPDKDLLTDERLVQHSTTFFTDLPHSWNWRYIVQAYNWGIVSGVDSAGTCNPESTITRAELCQILYKMGIHTPAQVFAFEDAFTKEEYIEHTENRIKENNEMYGEGGWSPYLRPYDYDLTPDWCKDNWVIRQSD